MCPNQERVADGCPALKLVALTLFRASRSLSLSVDRRIDPVALRALLAAIHGRGLVSALAEVGVSALQLAGDVVVGEQCFEVAAPGQALAVAGDGDGERAGGGRGG